MWSRNLQLAFFSIVCAILPLLLTVDGSRVAQNGFFHGYTPLTWACIAMNGWGGLLVGAVIKYADAILKDMALVSWAVPMYAGRAHLGLKAFGAPDAIGKSML